MSISPLVSVILPVFNCEQYIEKAILSILTQTYAKFELIIINDGSTDDTLNVIKRFNDNRIVIVENSINLGLAASLNKGFEKARGQYIARMDGDDVSFQTRIAKQLSYMIKHDVDICGTFVHTFGEQKEQIWTYPVNHHEIKAALFLNSPFAHPTVMFKTGNHKLSFRYDVSYKRSQDYELWHRLKKNYKFGNVPKILLAHRLTGKKKSMKSEILRLLLKELNPSATQEDHNIHIMFSDFVLPYNTVQLAQCRNWAEKIIRLNYNKQIYNQFELSSSLGYRLICYSTQFFGSFLKGLRYMSYSPLLLPAISKYPINKIRSIKSGLRYLK